ncbi:hypothetical protein GGS20DRAFT_584592 [Poronia punctata]|nr:hypothetical protein GGS20DRAFT_584592 [Poronia punctata]
MSDPHPQYEYEIPYIKKLHTLLTITSCALFLALFLSIFFILRDRQARKELMVYNQHLMPSHLRRHATTTSWLAILVVMNMILAVAGESDKSVAMMRRQSAGTSCAGSEGQWNCMTDGFQRCGSGVWSVVEQCAAGTACSPGGLTYEFHVDFADGYIGAGSSPPTSGAGSSGVAVRGLRGVVEQVVGLWLLRGLVMFFFFD